MYKRQPRGENAWIRESLYWNLYDSVRIEWDQDPREDSNVGLSSDPNDFAEPIRVQNYPYNIVKVGGVVADGPPPALDGEWVGQSPFAGTKAA